MTKTGQKSDFFCVFSCFFSEKIFFVMKFFAGPKVGWATSFSTSKQSLLCHFLPKTMKKWFHLFTFGGGAQKNAQNWGTKRAAFSAFNFQKGPALRCSWQKSNFLGSKNVTHFLGQNDHFWPFLRKKCKNDVLGYRGYCDKKGSKKALFCENGFFSKISFFESRVIRGRRTFENSVAGNRRLFEPYVQKSVKIKLRFSKKWRFL